jgi:hypothetical protein
MLGVVAPYLGRPARAAASAGVFTAHASVELAQNRRDVMIDGLLGDHQRRGDRSIWAAASRCESPRAASCAV